MIFKHFIIGMPLVALVGCATVIHGTRQQVEIETKQGGGHIVVYDDALYGIVSEFEGSLPTTVPLFRKKFYRIDIFHPDYGKKTIKIRPGYNYADALSNIFTVTMAVDTITGASRSFDEKITVDMEAVD